MTLAMELERQRQFGREEGREKGREEGRKEGRKEGREEERLQMILAMLKDGVAKETIAKYPRVSVEYITELGKKNHLL